MSSLNFEELRENCKKLIQEFEQNLFLVPPSLRGDAWNFIKNSRFNTWYDETRDCLNWNFKVDTPTHDKYDVGNHRDWEYWIGELSYYFFFVYNSEDKNGVKVEFFPTRLQVIYEHFVSGSRCKEVEYLTDIFPYASDKLLIDMGENFFTMVLRDFSELNLQLYKLMSETDPNIFYCWDEARKRAMGLQNLSGYKEAVYEVRKKLPEVIKKLVDSKSFAKSKVLAEARKELKQLQERITATLVT